MLFRLNPSLVTAPLCALLVFFAGSLAAAEPTPQDATAQTPAATDKDAAAKSKDADKSKADDADKAKATDKDNQPTANQIIKESMKGNGGNVLGVLPNFRTTNVDQPFVPLKSKEKFLIASKDSFYPTIFILSGAFAGFGQLANRHPQFGQGMEGYLKRYGTSYADQAIGNMMTEGLFPAMLHQDPRYFRLGTGSVLSRTGWAIKQIFVTRTDSGRHVFNASELVGNGVAAGISDIYYTDARNAHDTLQQWYMAVGTDMASDILKEFWPDIKAKISKHHPPASTDGH